MSGTSNGFDAESRPTASPLASELAPSKRRRMIRHEGGSVSENVSRLDALASPEDQSTALAEGENPAAKSAFEGFAEAMRMELAPADLLESLLADRVILSAWRVKSALRAEEVWTLNEVANQHLPTTSRLDCQPLNDLRRDARQAQTSLRSAMKDLERHRTRRSPQWGKAQKSDPREAPRPAFDHDPDARPAAVSAGNEWPVLPSSPLLPPPQIAVEGEAVPCWRDRLVYDFNISEYSPVVKGTWVTVNHIVTLVVDGWTWADILRNHPEMTEDDIRACLAFATEEEKIGR